MRTANSDDVTAVSWTDLSHVLRHKFMLFTGSQRTLSDSDLAYLAEKLVPMSSVEAKPILFQRFAKVGRELRRDERLISCSTICAMTSTSLSGNGSSSLCRFVPDASARQ